jgi:aspartyl/asparaginyl-tRNA synthetase
MTTNISPHDFTKVTTSLRQFFLDKNFLEVHTQNRLSILAACEDPTTVATYNYNDIIWPLPQTGQMWLEYELLNNPDLKGVFCVSTSYRQEQNPVEGRHEVIFPMFEFEAPGDFEDLLNMERDLVKHLGFTVPDFVARQFGFGNFITNGPFPEKTYKMWCQEFNCEELDHEHEQMISDSHPTGVGFITKFPYHTSPFWNMKKEKELANKCDVIMGGMETIGSAERSADPKEMEDQFHTISDGEYAGLLFKLFGKERVEKELKEFLSHKFFPRYGGGIGLTRLISALKIYSNLNPDADDNGRRKYGVKLEND